MFYDGPDMTFGLENQNCNLKKTKKHWQAGVVGRNSLQKCMTTLQELH